MLQTIRSRLPLAHPSDSFIDASSAIAETLTSPTVKVRVTLPAAGEEHAGDAANQREREIDHEDRGVARTAEGRHEQHEQSGDYRDEENGETPRGALLALELTAVFQTVPGICCSTQRAGPALRRRAPRRNSHLADCRIGQ